MPDEPDIEKTLRACAKRLRQEGGAPPELHPASRKLFQDEIARLNRVPRSVAGFRLNWLWASPARLAMGLACLVALFFLGSRLLHRHSSEPVELAKVNAPANERAQSSPSPPPVETPGSLKDGSGNVAPSDGHLMVQSAPPAPAPPGSTPDGGFAIAPAPRAESVLPSAPAADQVRAQAPTTIALTPSAAASNVTRRFTRLNTFLPLEALTGSNGPSLFRSLRVEQNGDQLNVIDENDGSVYTGLLTNVAPAITAPALTTTNLTAASAAPGFGVPPLGGSATGTNIVPVPSYSFSVSGTNRTLDQLVVLTGTVGPNIGGAFGRGAPRRGGAFDAGAGGGFGGGGGGGGAGGGVAPATPANSTNPTATGARLARGGRGGAIPAFQLRGTVTIGTNQFPINAAPAIPN